MKIEFVPVTEFGIPATAGLMTRAFADYLVKVTFDEAVFRVAEEMDSLRYADSPVVLVGGVPVGAVLMARRPGECRVAGMGIVPEARGRGVGQVAMERVIADARARGDRRMLLEVIEQNPPAVRLYESAGFKRMRRLVGFSRRAPAGAEKNPGLMRVEPREVAEAIGRNDSVDWPWQISAETVGRMKPPAIGYTLNGASLVIVDPSAPAVTIRTMVVDGEERRNERAARLLHAVMGVRPGADWQMKAHLPEEFEGWFASAGFSRQPISQWQMERGL